MTNEEVKRLLGGYATGTLNDAEQKELFEAALHDEALFEELAAEQGVKDLLDDPAHRAELLRALDVPGRKPWLWRWVPAAGALATIVVIASVVIYRTPRQEGTVSLQHLEMARGRESTRPMSTEPRELTEERKEQPDQLASGAASGKAKGTSSQAVPVMREQPPGAQAAADAIASVERSQVTRAGESASPSAPSSSAGGPATTAEPVSVNPQKSVLITAEVPKPVAQASPMAFSDQSLKKLNTFTARTEDNGITVQGTVLRRSAEGRFQPAEALTTFKPGESVRLELTSNATGPIAVFGTVGSSRQALYTGRIIAGMPLLVPVQLNDKDTKLTVSLTTAPVALAPFRPAVGLGNTALSGGVVGGLAPGVVTSSGEVKDTRAKARKTEPAEQEKAETEPASNVTLDLTLKVQ